MRDHLLHECVAIRRIVAAIVGDPYLGVGPIRQNQFKAGLDDTDYQRPGTGCAPHVAADNRRIGAKAAPKVVVAQDGDGAFRRRERRRRQPVWLGVSLREIAAQDDVGTQHREEIRRH